MSWWDQQWRATGKFSGGLLPGSSISVMLTDSRNYAQWLKLHWGRAMHMAMHKSKAADVISLWALIVHACAAIAAALTENVYTSTTRWTTGSTASPLGLTSLTILLHPFLVVLLVDYIYFSQYYLLLHLYCPCFVYLTIMVLSHPLVQKKGMTIKLLLSWMSQQTITIACSFVCSYILSR